MLLLAAVSAAAPTGASAQRPANKGTTTTTTNTFQGLSENRGQPVQIEAASLEVRDKDKMATFLGNVKVVQGETTVFCKKMVVYYEEQAPSPGGAAKPAQSSGGLGGGSQQISKLEASGGVKLVQKDQTATGDIGHFDMRANTVTLIGNVVVSQGGNVLRGERMIVDLTTGVTRVVAGKDSVKALIIQDGAQPAQPAPGQGGTQSQSPQSSSPPRRLGPLH